MTTQQIADAQVILNHAAMHIRAQYPLSCAAFSDAWDRMVLDYGVTNMIAASLLAEPELRFA